MNPKTLKPQQFAQLIGKSVITLQRWDREGKLVAQRTATNRRYYTYQQYLEYLGLSGSHNGKIVAYCRSSCASNSDDLELQKQHIAEYAQQQGLTISEWLTDYNSSLNYQREQFNRLLEMVEQGQIQVLIMAHKDRLVRFGYEWFEAFCQRHGTEIKLVCQSQFTPDKEELLNELKLIINLFSGKVAELALHKELLLQILGKLDSQKVSNNDS